MKLVPVEADKIPDLQMRRRGRVSYPILKQFMESNSVASMIDRTGVQQSMQGLNSCINAYAKNHNMPVHCFSRDGELYLLRLDLNGDGSPNPDYKPENERAGQFKGGEAGPAKDITDEIIEERSKTDGKNATK